MGRGFAVRFDDRGSGNVDFDNWWRSTSGRGMPAERRGTHLPRSCRHRAVAQLARVPVSKTGGWGFESLLPCECDPRMSRTHGASRSV
jgi:hypothetical protein